MGRLENKVIIVTGAATGLGLADARALIAEGARVIITDIDVDKGTKEAKDLDATFFSQDVSKESSWLELMTFVQEKFGRLDGLVNKAALP